MNKKEKEIAKAQLSSEEKTLKELQQVFKKARQDVQEKISELNARTDMQNLQSIIYQKKYQQAILNQINEALADLKSGQYKTVEEYLTESYDNGYIGMMYSLQSQGIPLTVPINDRNVVKALTTDSKLSSNYYKSNPLKGRLAEDVDLLKDRIRSNLSRGIVAGKSWLDVAVEIASGMNNPFEIALKDSMRIVRTEGHRVHQQGFLDAGDKAKEKGADILKQWDATMDSKTRPAHQQADGQIVEWDEYFTVGGEKMKAPSVGGSAKNVCNCRCQLLQRARWALDEAELETLQKRAEYFGLDKSESFEDYKQKYLKLPDKADTKTLNTVPTFTPAKTIKEAEDFVSQFVDPSGFASVGLSYKGVGLDVANELNDAFNTFFNTFNVKKLGGLSAPAKNTKLGKMVNAHMGYSPLRKSIVLNRDNTKNLTTFAKSLMEDKLAFKNLMEHPEEYDLTRLSKRIKVVLENSKQSGRAIVPDSVQESLFHELGHFLEDFMSKDEYVSLTKGIGEYGKNISGYACESPSEYIAESFASYMKGEDKIDPALKSYFDGLRK